MGFNYLKDGEPLLLGFQEILVLNWSNLEERKAELTLEPPIVFEPGTPEQEIQRLHQ